MIVRFRQIENLGRFGRLGHRRDVVPRGGAAQAAVARLWPQRRGQVDARAPDRRARGGRAARPRSAARRDRQPARHARGSRPDAQRYDEHGWTGPQPKVIITTFDRDFIDRNVFVGRRTSKDQRRHLLELALGAHDVQLAKRLDELTTRGREIVKARREHDAAIAAAAQAYGMSAAMFVALPAPVDVTAERAAAEAWVRAAVAADAAQSRLARPEPLAALPVARSRRRSARLLATESRQLGHEVAAKVEAHLAGRLRGAGDAWVRAGLDHADGRDVSVLRAGRRSRRADREDVSRSGSIARTLELVAQIDAARARRSASSTAWWREVQLRRRGESCARSTSGAEGLDYAELSAAAVRLADPAQAPARRARARARRRSSTPSGRTRAAPPMPVGSPRCAACTTSWSPRSRPTTTRSARRASASRRACTRSARCRSRRRSAGAHASRPRIIATRRRSCCTSPRSRGSSTRSRSCAPRRKALGIRSACAPRAPGGSPSSRRA